MYDFYDDDDAKVIFQAMKGKTESLIFDKYVKKYKTTYAYWLKWALGIKYHFNDTELNWR